MDTTKISILGTKGNKYSQEIKTLFKDKFGTETKSMNNFIERLEMLDSMLTNFDFDINLGDQLARKNYRIFKEIFENFFNDFITDENQEFLSIENKIINADKKQKDNSEQLKNNYTNNLNELKTKYLKIAKNRKLEIENGNL